MKKQVIYSLRMNTAIRGALKKAAQEESRSVASLLDKLIKDFLAKKGLLNQLDAIKDQRWFTRKEIYKPAHIFYGSDSETNKYGIVVLNISLGGVLIGFPKQKNIFYSSDDFPRFGLCMELSDEEESICFSCEANRMVDSGYGVQVAANFIDADPDDLQLLKSYLN
jgi:hypothetical protein